MFSHSSDGSRVDAEVRIQDERFTLELWIGEDRSSEESLLQLSEGLHSIYIFGQTGNIFVPSR